MSEERDKHEPAAESTDVGDKPAATAAEAEEEEKKEKDEKEEEEEEENKTTKAQTTMKDLMSRPARRQSTTVREFTPVMSGDYNIWYHRYIGYEYHESRKDRGVLTRCSVERDAGRTRADANAPICIHFAMGDCVRGHECQVCPFIPIPSPEAGGVFLIPFPFMCAQLTT